MVKSLPQALDADVGNLTEFTIKLANTKPIVLQVGYRRRPSELWSASIETSDQNNPSIVANLSPSMADHPITGNAIFPT